ncbi:bifunctional phosphoribosyl-AMP cyclohydrolase/phosphoribosyl-ATP diphosphatase HisIE [Buchnera aphidicola]|uniref:Histidine biosynthesis bifunctional protein HisIE n=1 Tax=Buchnera aphidicola subsp. Melaphis rhois TaxID=118103 RepID=A0A4D6YAG8_BUCMH|nr:bifunctional phosphoribosyl-AMP cyclohydrolase/phosphoribosyl-ATP diphosphatase HisIE [Buchnera aphidicola]QCI23138.1 bifunctional phosphoribosyl-AMP cyclohydrolase/phosphoribosyl-ATP diphosphatase HisIE [Buchnera aphidicola (Melaphis rhois)]
MLKKINVSDIDWNKVGNMVPTIIQHSISGEVLMYGVMNQEAVLITQKEHYVTFYSRTKKRLWKKGEISGNYLRVVNMILDCDKDTLLILVLPQGNTCHLNHTSCFKSFTSDLTFFYHLENILKLKQKHISKHSYTSRLHVMGINKIAQKVAEEAAETVISAITQNKLELIDEVTDLIYHVLVLLHHCDLDFCMIVENLRKRRNNNTVI